MKKIVLVLFLACSMTSFAQILFEKGYFIDNQNQKTECLIKNVDWKNNPTEFKYKLSEDDAIKEQTLKKAKEFGVYGDFRYIRSTVLIDRSGTQLTNLSEKRQPEFSKETIYLKVIIESKASLYAYEGPNNFRRFFYATDSLAINQLVYKRYKLDYNGSNRLIKDNNQFRQQLKNSFVCSSIDSNDFTNLEYTKNDLVKIFTVYNECSNSTSKNYTKNEKKNLIKLQIRPGFAFSNMKLEKRTGESPKVDFGNKINPRIGLEVEATLPFYQNKLALLMEPAYSRYSSQKVIPAQELDFGQFRPEQEATISYAYWQLYVGIRHYFFLSEDARIFLNIGLAHFRDFDAKIETDTYIDLEVTPKFSTIYGAGFKFRRYALEMRYTHIENLTEESASFLTDYESLSFVLSYSLW